MISHTFVDESKRRDYLLIAATVDASDLDRVRKLLAELLLGRERRLHMKNENDRRKRSIAAAIAGSGITATVYDAGRRYPTELERRAACLAALVDDAAVRGDERLLLEQDDTLLSWDNQRLIEATRAAGCRNTLRYEHHKTSAEHLLALPDAIGWCWAKGGDWRRRIQPVITVVRRV
jgi:hypothetical protein